MVSAAAAGAVRRSEGFARFAVAVQYHGGSFLGFTYQGKAVEDSIIAQTKKNGQQGTTDLRGYRSVEGRLREALDDLFGKRKWENIQASSRTDRGVHALKNTFHVDIQMPNSSKSSSSSSSHNNNISTTACNDGSETHPGKETCATADEAHSEHERIERKLTDGLNFYLARQSHGFDTKHNHPKGKQNPTMNELRIVNASKSPEFMDNPYARTEEGKAKNQPPQIDWNARFSASQRTYVYRILCNRPRQQPREGIGGGSNSSSNDDDDRHDEGHHLAGVAAAGIPFEWDRAWCLPVDHSKHSFLDVAAMREAADCLVGTHDFSSFRGRSCQRKSPIVTVSSVDVRTDHRGNGFLPFGSGAATRDHHPAPTRQLVAVTFVANSFLYRQVRNMVGCLVEVGKRGGKLRPEDVRALLAGATDDDDDVPLPRDGDRWGRTKFKHRPYSTAPPQGLFLVDVRHGGFRF